MKNLETTKQREEATKLIAQQLEVLNLITDSSIEPLIIELKARYKFLSNQKHWLFGFQGGGWNSIYAMDKEEAINKAQAKYDNGNSKVDLRTFRIQTPEDERNLLSNFY